MSSSAARVWITTGFPSSRASGELALEEELLRVVRRVVAEVVEPRLAHRNGLRMREQRLQLGNVVCLRAAGLVRMDAERRVDAVVRVREGERVARAGERRRDRDDPRDARLACAGDHLGGVVPEVRVRVDHASPRIRCSSSSTVESSSLRKSGFGSSSACPGGRSLGSQLPTHVE